MGRREIELLGLNVVAVGTTLAFGAQPSGMFAAALFNFGLRSFTLRLQEQNKITRDQRIFIDKFGDATVVCATTTYLASGTANFLVEYGLNIVMADVASKAFTYGFIGSVYRRDALYMLNMMHKDVYPSETEDVAFASKNFAIQLAKYSFLPLKVQTWNDLALQFASGVARNFTTVAVDMKKFGVDSFVSKIGMLKTAYQIGIGGMNMATYAICGMLHEINPLKVYLGNAATFAPFVGFVENCTAYITSKFSADDFVRSITTKKEEDNKKSM